MNRLEVMMIFQPVDGEHDGMRYPISRHTQKSSDFETLQSLGKGCSILFSDKCSGYLSQIWQNLSDGNTSRTWVDLNDGTTVNTKNVTVYDRIRFQPHSWAWGSTKLFKSFCHLVGMQ